MMKLACILLSLSALTLPAFAQTNPLLGRWDVTVTSSKATYPDWIEVTEQNGKPQARVQVRAGSVRPAAEVKVNGSHLTLLLTRASAGRPETTWDLNVEGDRITGTQRQGNAVAQLAGVRAPELKRPMPKSWTTAEALFNGKDLTGWEPSDQAQNHWVAKDGVLLNEAHGANLKSARKFDDFKLHIEFNCPEKGNSGIYLRGRYEVQVEYEPAGSEDKYHSMGSIYGYLGSSKE